MKSDVRLRQILDEYSMEIFPVSVEVKATTGTWQRFDCRVIAPSADGLMKLQERGIAFLSEPEDQLALHALALLGDVAADTRRRFNRRPSRTAIYRSQPAGASTGVKARCLTDLVRDFVTTPEHTTSELLQLALYVDGFIPFDFDEREFERFCHEVLSGVEHLYERVTNGDLGEDAFEVAQRRHLRRGIDLTKVPNINQRWRDHLEKLWPRILRHVVAAAQRMERESVPEDSREDMFEQLLRIVDTTSSMLMGLGARALYRRIRSYLTPPERRLFAFMFLPVLPGADENLSSLPFDGWMVFDLPFFTAFVEDEELCALTVAVIGYKRLVLGDEDLRSRLRDLFHAHLTFYAWWVRSTREDDRDRKRAQRAPREVALDERRSSSEPTAPDAPPISSEPIRQVLESIIDRGRSPRRQAIARLYLLDGLTQSAIAEELGIRQQAVSKTLNRILDQDLPPGALPPDQVRKGLREMGLLRRGRRKKPREEQ